MDIDNFCFYVNEKHNGSRLDICIYSYLKHHSRSYFANLARSGHVYVNGLIKKPSYKVNKGELVLGFIQNERLTLIDSEKIPLDVIYEDSSILVINKHAGIVVHPSPGHSSGTIVNAVMNYYKSSSNLNNNLLIKKDSYIQENMRPGVVHRLDKNTTGVLVLAKNTKSFLDISSQFKQRSVSKQYLAIVYGIPKNDKGCIDLAIGRHRTNRKRMSIYSKKPRLARTLWNTLEKYDDIASLLEINIETGRTHQIRVHCKAIGHPILGDKTYRNKGIERHILTKNNIGVKLKRQMLHAKKIEFIHPENRKHIVFEAKLPNDILDLLQLFRSKYLKKN